MKPQGRTNRPKVKLEGHGDCGVCLEQTKPPNRTRSKQRASREFEMANPKMSKVFESVFHGQVYKLDGKGYDVPKLTYWCQDNLEPVDFPLGKLTMSKSDEKHGSDKFKKHAKKVDRKKFPIVVVARQDGRFQIADGNHRAWQAAEAGEKTIRALVVPEADLPESALVKPEKGEEEKK